MSESDWSIVGAELVGDAPNDQIGYSVSMSADGTRVAVGSNQGGAAVYLYDGTTWNKVIIVTNTIKTSVSLSEDGTVLAVGYRVVDFGNNVEVFELPSEINESW